MKKHILFVDDDPNVLDGLKRMLRSKRDEWVMDFASSGKEALAIMAIQECDIIVSDMRMPGMDGPELLKRVLNEHPDTVRMVLSGHSEINAAIRAMGIVHQYISKPCDSELLKETLSRAFMLRNLLTNEKLLKRINEMTSIPSLPHLYMELSKELRNYEVSMKRISNIIEKDVGMTAKILQLVNSSFFGLSRKISDIGQAVRLLGIETIKTLVLSLHIFSEINESSIKGFSMRALWDHSIDVGNLARVIAETETSDSNLVEVAFIGGVLHDCGCIILANNFPGEYKKVIQMNRVAKMPFGEAERRVFGTTHAEVGAYLLGLWGMSDDLVEAIAFHHYPDESETRSFKPMTAVHVADYLHDHIMNRGELQDDIVLSNQYLAESHFDERLENWKNACEEILMERVNNEQKSSICR